MRKILEKQPELKPKRTFRGTVNASNRNSDVLNASEHSVRDKDSSRNTDVFFSEFTRNDNIRIHALNPSDRKGSDVPVPLFPPVRVSLQRGERADYLSEFSRVSCMWRR